VRGDGQYRHARALSVILRTVPGFRYGGCGPDRPAPQPLVPGARSAKARDSSRLSGFASVRASNGSHDLLNRRRTCDIKHETRFPSRGPPATRRTSRHRGFVPLAEESVLGVYATCWRRRVDKLRVLLVDDVCMDNLCGSGLLRAFADESRPSCCPCWGCASFQGGTLGSIPSSK
jgi:hypothetical protein